MHQPMKTTAIRREGEEGRAMQQAFQIQVGTLADQFQVEAIGLADGLAAPEFEHLEVVLDAFEGKREVGLVGWGEHGVFPSLEIGRADIQPFHAIQQRAPRQAEFAGGLALVAAVLAQAIHE